jgi:DNA-binding GntR family transcriptional regulator
MAVVGKGGFDVTAFNDIVALDPFRPIAPQLSVLLRARIIRNQLRPGDRISESEIAAAYGISRQPVREAFIKLQEQGLLMVLPQRGTVISKIAYQAVLDARFLREAIETDIVMILAHAPDPGLIANLRGQIAAQRAVRPDDREGFTQLDDGFHRMLADAAGKAGAWRLIDGLKSQMDRVRFLSLDSFPVTKLIDQHEAIVTAIAAGDSMAAEAGIRGHLREVLLDLPGIIAAAPAFFDTADGVLAPPVNTPIPNKTPIQGGYNG